MLYLCSESVRHVLRVARLDKVAKSRLELKDPYFAAEVRIGPRKAQTAGKIVGGGSEDEEGTHHQQQAAEHDKVDDHYSQRVHDRQYTLPKHPIVAHRLSQQAVVRQPIKA